MTDFQETPPEGTEVKTRKRLTPKEKSQDVFGRLQRPVIKWLLSKEAIPFIKRSKDNSALESIHTRLIVLEGKDGSEITLESYAIEAVDQLTGLSRLGGLDISLHKKNDKKKTISFEQSIDNDGNIKIHPSFGKDFDKERDIDEINRALQDAQPRLDLTKAKLAQRADLNDITQTETGPYSDTFATNTYFFKLENLT